MGDDALIPLKLFKNPTFSMATGLGVLVGFGMFGAMMTIPLYLQLVNGATPTESGFLMLPMILGLMISSIVSGQVIARTGRYSIFPKTGTAFMALGFLWLTFLEADRPVIWIMIGMLLVGLGLGQLMQTLTIASQNSVGPKDMGVATSSSTFFRQIGGTLGVAILFSVLFTPLADRDRRRGEAGPRCSRASQRRSLIRPWPATRRTPASSRCCRVANPASAVGGDTSFLTGADPRLTAPFLEGFNSATVSVYWVALGVVLLAFILSFFLKTAPLREKSALQESADNDAAVLAQEAADATGSPIAPVMSEPADTADPRPRA